VFSVEIWQLPASVGANARERVFAGVVQAEALMEMDAHGRLSYVIPEAYADTPHTLSLIITRLDAWETLDPAGEYSIALHPVPRS
jgi:alkylation response protein AidB-like acyl-CoA dehydrogenase